MLPIDLRPPTLYPDSSNVTSALNKALQWIQDRIATGCFSTKCDRNEVLDRIATRITGDFAVCYTCRFNDGSQCDDCKREIEIAYAAANAVRALKSY